MDHPEFQPRLTRREVIKWFGAAAAAMSAGDLFPLTNTARAATPGQGYGTDIDFTKAYQPGDVWPLTLTEAQRRTVTALCDVLLPADNLGPAASTVGVPVFIDEWVSAPYPEQRADNPIIIKGIEWLDAESKKRFQADFVTLKPEQYSAICDDICNPPTAKPEFKDAATFFSRFRDIACAGYFTTPDGWKAVGYVGNTPMIAFEGPPPEVLTHLGVEQTVK